jgi:LEA14-like dessication related protein
MNFFFIGITTALLLCGCQTSPKVSLVSAHFQAATMLETTAVFTLRLENDETSRLEITGAAHKIYLNGLYVGEGLSDAMLTVPRLSSITNDVTMHLSNLALATRIKSSVESKQVDYRIQSTFYGKSWLGRTHSESTGRLNLQDFVSTESATSQFMTPLPVTPADKFSN